MFIKAHDDVWRPQVEIDERRDGRLARDLACGTTAHAIGGEQRACCP
jgi:hypothetical protein